MTEGVDASTYKEVGGYYPQIAARVLAEFVLRAEYLGFAKELDQPPTPDQKGVTEIELSPGIIKYYDTSLINGALHAKIFTENGEQLYLDLHVDDRNAAFQGLLCDEETKRRNNLPEHTINPAWYEHLRIIDWK